MRLIIHSSSFSLYSKLLRRIKGQEISQYTNDGLQFFDCECLYGDHLYKIIDRKLW